MPNAPIDAHIRELQQQLEQRYPHLEWLVKFNHAPIAAGRLDPTGFVWARRGPGQPSVRVQRHLDELDSAASLETFVNEITEEILGALKQV